MDDDSKANIAVKAGLGMLGLGAIAAAITIPKIGIWVAVAILLLALVLFGSYYLWRRMRARKHRQQLSFGVESQAGAVPKNISDPNQRAQLDAIRQKFLNGMQVFRSRGKDIYKLPWFVIIGESGSGKSMAIRNSGIDFPPGMQDEMQGSGGTINMDWWFTNRGIILDTAGKMIIPDESQSELKGEWNAPGEWTEFLRLLRKARPHCPINGLMLVLSAESLIKDSADKIARKASRLAQQLDLIQRTLDVRFPVYLLVTKCDLMEGFREFSDTITDPLLQHQMFGWSNPDPLDAAFRPDLVDQYLQGLADHIRRRRLALLRDTTAGHTQTFFKSTFDTGRTSTSRRTDSTNSSFALPESVMLLAPRLRRYLETIFVAGEWSAKPVFLRGIYFTSSMREGSALDEALALAANVSVDELPETGGTESRAFFLRDLFNEKIFREGGLVTRATNTLKMLRQRRLAIFGTATVLLLLLLSFSAYSFVTLRKSVMREKQVWNAGTNRWLMPDKIWAPGVIAIPGASDPLHYTYSGSNTVEGTGFSVVDYHKWLKDATDRHLAVGLVFKPIAWLGEVSDRPDAQRLLFEDGVLKPLVEETRTKIMRRKPSADNPDNLRRYRDALLALMGLEADHLGATGAQKNTVGSTNAAKYLKSFVSYLTEADNVPDPSLVEVFVADYSNTGGRAAWPPDSLMVPGGDHLSNNPAIFTGLTDFREANIANELQVKQLVKKVNDLVGAMTTYTQGERDWLRNPGDPCVFANATPFVTADNLRRALVAATNLQTGSNIASLYTWLEQAAEAASTSSFDQITANLPPEYQNKGIFLEIKEMLLKTAGKSIEEVKTNYTSRVAEISNLDSNSIAQGGLSSPAYVRRHDLYQEACELTKKQPSVDQRMLGDGWRQYENLREAARTLTNDLAAYDGPMGDLVRSACSSIVSNSIVQLQGKFIDSYVAVALSKLTELKALSCTTMDQVTNSRSWLSRVDLDIQKDGIIGDAQRLSPVVDNLQTARQSLLAGIGEYMRSKIGFPVRINSPKWMAPQEVMALRDFLAPLSAELNDPAWRMPEELQKRSASFSRTASAIYPKGEPTRGTLYFVPAKSDADLRVTDVYRWVRVTGGRIDGDWREITFSNGGDVRLAELPVDAPLRISCCEHADPPEKAAETTQYLTPQPGSYWGLIHMLQLYHAVTEDGKTWVFRVPVRDPKIGPGNMNFKIIFDNALPKMEDWPKE